MEILLIFFSLVVIFFGTDYLIRKLLKVEKVKISETPGGEISQWGSGIILIVGLAMVMLFIDDFTEGILWFWIFYFISIGFLEAFLERKYFRESKAYLVSLLQIPFTVGVLLCVAYMFR